MNVYISTNKNMVGVALTDENHRVGFYRAFETRTDDKEAQVVLGCQRAIGYIVANKPLGVTDTMNIYSDSPVNLDKIHNDEYIKRHQFKFEHKHVTTDREKNAMLTAQVEIEMESRRQWIRGGRSR